MKQSTSEFIDVRGYRTHVRHWGTAGQPLLVMFHGWGDTSASWQFVVDELQRDWHVVAPDWRGCGKTEFQGSTYYFPDWLADIDAILDRYSPQAPAVVAGHSMGGNAACLYAGVRPERVARLVNLEGVGLWRTEPDQAPEHYAKWLRTLKKSASSGLSFRTYPDRPALSARLRHDNPRLTVERADFLAENFGVENDTGGISLALDPAHRLWNPVLYRVEEAMACWRRITAPVLLVTAADSSIFREFFAYDSAEHRLRVACFRNIREEHLADCGHNLHHDRPETVARLIEEFVS